MIVNVWSIALNCIGNLAITLKVPFKDIDAITMLCEEIAENDLIVISDLSTYLIAKVKYELML